MTILDSQLMFDSAAAITVSRASTNIVNLVNPRDLGVGDPDMKLGIYTGPVPFAGPGGTTLNVQFQGSVDSVNWVTYAETGAIPLASLGANSDIASFRVPQIEPNGGPLPQYWQLNYVVGGGPFTAGSITAVPMLDKGANRAYPNNYTVPTTIKTFP